MDYWLVLLRRPASHHECTSLELAGLGFTWKDSVPSRRKSGGIALFWKNVEAVNLLSFSRSHIDISVYGAESKSWCLTGIDGEPARTQRFKMWELLKNLSRDANLPWCVMEDLNNVTSQTDKRGSPSDHSPLLLCPEMQLRRNKRRPFRFENAWLTEPMCSQIIKDCWEEEEDNTILQKLSKCAESLNVWGKEIIGSFSSRIKDCKAKLKLLRGKRDAWYVAEFENTRQQLFLVLDQKEIFWRQRSKQLWLQAGEKNTKYFHASCKKRKRNNHIQKLKNADGAWVD
ncbi:uncharacterized protein LOC141708914 [Apium graveolens]|uniref:uncharacterized protein LOC141708914 n=1 Tax=Apium graveolens TaxID=4045 RepID=UPI003D79E0BF